jgi:hypothetical protein
MAWVSAEQHTRTPRRCLALSKHAHGPFPMPLLGHRTESWPPTTSCEPLPACVSNARCCSMRFPLRCVCLAPCIWARRGGVGGAHRARLRHSPTDAYPSPPSLLLQVPHRSLHPAAVRAAPRSCSLMPWLHLQPAPQDEAALTPAPLHARLRSYDPVVHCPHLSPDGGGACARKSYDSGCPPVWRGLAPAALRATLHRLRRLQSPPPPPIPSPPDPIH